MSKVFLGMSGGVDSSVSAILLKSQGYDVTGVYMKNWSKDLPGMKCPWAEDLADAKRVAVQLDLDFEVWDFEADYKQKVVDYMLSEFQRGRTPNPDVMCNQEIKFKLFYERAMARGADYIATGHYARVERLEALSSVVSRRETIYNTTEEESGNAISVFSGISATNEERMKRPEPRNDGPEERRVSNEKMPDSALLMARDENKDQTYFLYRMSDEATAHTIFPIGHLTKPEVKRLAERHGLDVAHKKESMGVCFVGEVGMKDFLREYLDAQPGEIREIETDQVLGYHDGAIFYTLGQRHGLYLGGGLPFYVVQKDLERNIVYVSRNLNHASLWSDGLQLEDLHLRNNLTAQELAQIPNLRVRLRHRAPLIDVQAEAASVDKSQAKSPSSCKPALKLNFSAPIRRPASGQSAVLYAGEVCLGGGIVK